MGFAAAQANRGLAIIHVLTLFFYVFPCRAEAQDQRLAHAEHLYAQRPDLVRVRQAIALVAELANADPQSYEAQWRLARYYHFLGKHVADKNERRRALEAGMEAGKRAVALQSNRPEGHFWLAANYGTDLQEKSIFTRWRLVKPIRQELEAVIHIDPYYVKGSAYAVLGKLYSEVPKLFGGNLEQGIADGEQAVKIRPDNSLAKLYLAESYLRAGRKPEAKRLLQEILTMSPDKDFEFEFTENQQEARRLLKENFKE
jgi:tetratricopeptide (TPR) repeat protein